MKIAVFGTGAVGGYLGGRLAQAGNDVTFIARGAHLKSIQSDGLRVRSINGDFSIDPAKTTDHPETIGTVDLILCCVKSWQVKEIADQIKPLIKSDTIIIPIQNGVEAHTTLSNSIGGNHILPGLCKMISLVEAPGVISHIGIDPYLSFGEFDGSPSLRLDKLAKLFTDVKGVTINPSVNILQELWLKFMIIAPWSGMGALTRSPVGIFRRVQQTRELLKNSIQEVFDVAQANGVNLDANAVKSTIDFIDSVPAEGTASMQRDIMDGKPSELNEQCGAVVRYGEKKRVHTPANRFIYHSLLPLEYKARGEISF